MITKTVDIIGKNYELRGIVGKIQSGRRIPIVSSTRDLEDGDQLWFVGNEDPSIKVRLPYLTTFITPSGNIYSLTRNSGEFIGIKLTRV